MNAMSVTRIGMRVRGRPRCSPTLQRVGRHASRALLAAATALLVLAPLPALAQTRTVEGDLVRMVVDQLGRPAIYVKPSTATGPSDPFIRQYYNPNAWGNLIWVDGGTAGRFSSGYLSSTGTTVPVSNTVQPVPGGSSIVTVVDLGATGLRLTQTFTYINGTRYVTKDWTIENHGGVTRTDLRFFHGGDTYFGDDDAAYGFYDAANSMVYIRNQDTDNWGIMGFYANPLTPAGRYFEGHYSTGNSQASGGQLSNTVDANYVDAGYYLQWNRASLAPGETWSIQAFEVWTPAGNLQVLAPGNQNVTGGAILTLPFTVQNLGADPQPVTVSAASTQAWGVTILGPTAFTIPANSSAQVNVQVTVPPSATGASQVTLTATGDFAISTSTTVTVVDLDLAIVPASVDFGTIVPGGTGTPRLITITNEGNTPIRLGALTAPAPFGTTADTCSNAVLATGASCTITATFAPFFSGVFSAGLNVPVVDPILVTRSVGLSGIGVSGDERMYFLAEGVTLWTFHTTLSVMNPSPAQVPVVLTFLKSDGTTEQIVRTLEAGDTEQVLVNDLPGMQNAAFSTLVESPSGAPLVVERSVTWSEGDGGHAEVASEFVSTAWHFAEGAQSDYLDTYFLFGNPGAQDATVTITFLRQGAGPVGHTLTVPARGRATLYAHSLPELRFYSFGAVVSSSQPIVAERSVYFGTTSWDGGTVARGVTGLSNTWHFAEGSTGEPFSMFLLLANPNLAAANVTVTYLLASGTAVQESYVVAAGSRRTVFVNTEVPGMADQVGVGMMVSADQPIVAERAMYWPGSPGNWRDGHVSAGTPVLAPSWALADGASGLVEQWQTFLLLANPGGTGSTVEVTYTPHGGQPPIARVYVVPASGRLTVSVNDLVPELADQRFSMVVRVVTGPDIVVERASYWTIDGVTWTGGTAVMGMPLMQNHVMPN
jgi:hypothetical protein